MLNFIRFEFLTQIECVMHAYMKIPSGSRDQGIQFMVSIEIIHLYKF
jgi:hypothetical protein